MPPRAGHSLGAAVATLDATMLRMQLPSSVEVDCVTFGLPRVGNQEFADMIDSLVRAPSVCRTARGLTTEKTQFPTFTHVTNQKDPVPDVPPRFLSYQHPQGEVHITSVSSSGAATLVACPGQENKVRCLLGASVPISMG